MKKLILVLFLLFTQSVFAINHFIKKSDFDSNVSDPVIYSGSNAKSFCGDCYKIKEGFEFNAAYAKLKNETINGDPIYSKSEVNNCSEYCESLFKSESNPIICNDTEETPILNLDLNQIYCSKLIGYEQVQTGEKIIVVDKDKKDLYDAVKDAKREAKILEREEREAEIAEIKAMIADVNASDLPPWHKKLLRVLIRDMKE